MRVLLHPSLRKRYIPLLLQPWDITPLKIYKEWHIISIPFFSVSSVAEHLLKFVLGIYYGKL